MLPCGFYFDCTVPLKSKLPVASRFLCNENHVVRYAILVARHENRVARESFNRKANFNTQQSTCRRGKTVFTVKLYHRFLKSLKNCGHDTNVLTVFRPLHAMRIASCTTGIA